MNIEVKGVNGVLVLKVDQFCEVSVKGRRNSRRRASPETHGADVR